MFAEANLYSDNNNNNSESKNGNDYSKNDSKSHK